MIVTISPSDRGRYAAAHRVSSRGYGYTYVI
jgi:hypothetical protein